MKIKIQLISGGCEVSETIMAEKVVESRLKRAGGNLAMKQCNG